MKVTNDAICDLLAETPLPSKDIAEFFPGSTHRDVAAALSRMRRAATRRVYIKAWVRDADGGARPYLRPVYALGSRRDAPKPRNFTNAERVARYYAKKQLYPRQVPTSVFNLAKTS